MSRVVTHLETINNKNFNKFKFMSNIKQLTNRIKKLTNNVQNTQNYISSLDGIDYEELKEYCEDATKYIEETINLYTQAGVAADDEVYSLLLGSIKTLKKALDENFLLLKKIKQKEQEQEEPRFAKRRGLLGNPLE